MSEWCWISSIAKRTDRFHLKSVKLPEFQLKADPNPEILVGYREIQLQKNKKIRYIILILKSNVKDKLIIQGINGVLKQKNGHIFSPNERTLLLYHVIYMWLYWCWWRAVDNHFWMLVTSFGSKFYEMFVVKLVIHFPILNQHNSSPHIMWISSPVVTHHHLWGTFWWSPLGSVPTGWRSHLINPMLKRTSPPGRMKDDGKVTYDTCDIFYVTYFKLNYEVISLVVWEFLSIFQSSHSG